MYPYYNSWAPCNREKSVTGEIKLVNSIKVKRGRPICADRYDHGYGCLIEHAVKSGREYFYFNETRRIMHTASAVCLWSRGYISFDGNAFEICAHDGTRIAHINGRNTCDYIGCDCFMIDKSVIINYRTNNCLDLSSECGYIPQVVNAGNTFVAVGDSGITAFSSINGNFKCHWNIKDNNPDVYRRIVPIRNEKLAYLCVSRSEHTTDYYQVSLSDGQCEFVCRAPFEAQQHMLANRFTNGILPLGTGVVCYGCSGTVPPGDYYCDYNSKEYRPFCVPRSGALSECRVSSCGFMISLMDSLTERGRILSVHDDKFIERFSVLYPRKYPLPSYTELLNVLPNGILAISDGKSNHEVCYYEIV